MNNKIFLLMIFSLILVMPMCSAWWNESWVKCKNLNVTGSNETLLDFPFYVEIDYDSDMQSDFDDVIFVNATCDGNGSQMAHEVDYKQEEVKSGFWIKAETLNIGINQFSVYYGNSNATNSENPQEIWGENYHSVYHFSDNSSILKDSLGNYNGTLTGGPILNDSIFGRSYHFNGSNYATFSSIGSLGSQWDGGGSYSIWFRPDAIGVPIQWTYGISGTPTFHIAYNWEGTDTITTGMRTGDGGDPPRARTPDSQVTTEMTNYYSYWSTSSGSAIKFYVNGSSVASTIPNGGDATLSGLANVVIGGLSTSGPVMGDIDELRLSNQTFSGAWVSRANSNKDFSLFVFDEEQEFSIPKYTIIFNLTDTYTGEQIDTSSPQDDFDLSCNNGVNGTALENLYSAIFEGGNWECVFSGLTIIADKLYYFTETKDITVTQNETIEIPMSRIGALTKEEHDWLEAVYNCLIEGTGCAS